MLIVSEETSFGMPALICAWRGDLSLTGLDHLAHDDVLDLLGRHVGALKRGLDGDPAEVSGVQRGESAPELADWGARGTEDDGLGHRISVSRWWSGARGHAR